jgi:HK97 family phage prohead protease
LDYSAIPLEVVELKAGKDGWSFSAYASTFGNLDHTGDVILAGAFDATLLNRTFRPLLWQHDMREPIGIEKSLAPDGKGLLGNWELIDTQRGSDAYKLLKRGAIRSMSIGYIPEVVEFDASGIRLIRQIDLLENSVVSIPANEMATVTSVKALDIAVPFENLIAQLKGYTTVGVDEVEALFDRRRAEFRQPTEAHIGAVQSLLDDLKGSAERLEALLHADDEQPSQVKAGEAMSLRLELARRRLRHAGVEI